MTLLLNLVGPRGVHQSSDLRLTDVMTRRPIEDGSEQLHHMTNMWSAGISFTGGRSTLNPFAADSAKKPDKINQREPPA
jgi:hypothetical protein